MATMMMSKSNSSSKSKQLVCPGHCIGKADELTCGDGTYSKDGRIIASILGYVSVDGNVTSVHHHKKTTSTSSLIPRVGNIILGKISRITANLANVDIMIVEGNVLPQACGGIIRVEDVLPDVDITAVQMVDCFRPGDVVKARIISMGDSRQYFLSTAEVNLEKKKIHLCTNSNDNLCEH
jgi:exosome complex component CSL4